MIQHDFDSSLGFWVGSAAHLIERTVTAELADTGITLRQVQVLACLALYRDMSQGAIAEALGVEPSTIVRVIDRMERDGWVARHADPGDRRRNVIRPTEKVEPHWDHIVATGQAVEKRATEGLTQKQLKNLKTTLAIITKNLGGEG